MSSIDLDRRRAASLLSWVLVVGMVFASAVGLLVDDIYEDPAAVAARFRASDLVTLALAAPILAAAPWRSRGKSMRALLVWASMLAYGVYSYAFYVFGTAFNAIFLLHVALFALSIYALILLLASVDVAALRAQFGPKTPVRLVGGFLAFMGLALAVMWVFNSIRFAITGEPPSESYLVNRTEDIHLAYVLDLALLVPAYGVAGVLLWRRQPWGYLLAAVLLVSSVFHQLNYVIALVFQIEGEVPGAAFDPIEPFIAAAFIAGAVALLANVRGRLQAEHLLGPATPGASQALSRSGR
jgi:hypothetical protein